MLDEEVYMESGSDAKFKAKRKKIEDRVIKTFDLMDPTGTNKKYYQELFKNMSDTQFKKYMNDMKKDEDMHFTMNILPFENEFNYESIRKVSEFLKVPMEEYLYYKDTNTGTEYRTKHQVSVGYIHIKRLRVKRSLRNSFKEDISKGLVA